MKGLVKEDRRKTNSKNRVAASLQGQSKAALQGQGHFPGEELQRLVQQQQQPLQQQQLILQALQQQLLLNGVLQR